MNKKFEIVFAGRELKIDAVRPRDLADMIMAIDEMVTAARSSPSNAGHSVAILAVQAGSIRLQGMAVDDDSAEAYRRVAGAVARRDYSAIPTPSLEGLRRIAHFAGRYRCSASFTAGRSSKPIATVDADTKIPRHAPVFGETTVFGTIIRAGGKSPTVHVELSDGRILSCTASKKHAKELGAVLYTTVGLRGHATWDPITMRVESFAIKSIEPYRDGSVVDAFAELSKELGGFFTDVEDIDGYVKSIRHG